MTLIDYDKLLIERLKLIPDEYKTCRDLRHLWKVEKDLHFEGQIGGRQRIERTMNCTRCGTVKTEHYVMRTSVSGIQRLASIGYHYTYPPLYAIPEMARVESPREILRATRFSRSTSGP